MAFWCMPGSLNVLNTVLICALSVACHGPLCCCTLCTLLTVPGLTMLALVIGARDAGPRYSSGWGTRVQVSQRHSRPGCRSNVTL
jgi:hypothetical protein